VKKKIYVTQQKISGWRTPIWTRYWQWKKNPVPVQAFAKHF